MCRTSHASKVVATTRASRLYARKKRHDKHAGEITRQAPFPEPAVIVSG